MNEVKINLWNPHKNQNKLLDDGNRFKVIVCGRRFGKTTYAVNYLVEEALLNDGGHYFYVAPTYRQAKMIAWEMLMQACDKLPKELIKRKHESELYVTLGNDSRIDIKGADNPDSLRGVGLNGIVMDEYADIKPHLFQEIIRPALTDKKGWAIFIGTPRGFNHFHKLYEQAGTTEHWSRFKFTSYDNPHIDPDEIEQAKKEITEDKFAQEYMADFRKFEGLIYSLHGWHTVSDMPEKADITIGGVDWGWENPSAIVIIKLRDGVYTIVDEYYEKKKTTPELIERMQNLQRKWGVNRWYADSAEPDRIEEASRGTGLYVIPFEKRKGSVNAGIDHINQLLKENRLFVHEQCLHTLNEFNSYHWHQTKDGTAPPIEAPEKEDDHIMDAMRYAVHGYSPSARIPTAPSTIFTKIHQRTRTDERKHTEYN